MSAIKKQNIPFYVTYNVGPDISGLAATLSASYRKQGDSGSWTTVTGTFVEEKPGFYTLPITLADLGTYNVAIESTDDILSADRLVGSVTVVKATVNDVIDAIQAAQSDITGIKGQIDMLDEQSLDLIKSTVDTIQTKVDDLKVLLVDENDPAITSLKELILAIQAAGSERDSVIGALTAYTDDIEYMLSGTATLKDGSANPFFGKTGYDIYDLLVVTAQNITDAINTAKTAILTDAQAKSDLVITKLASMKTTIDANSDMLTNAGYGLAAIKGLLDTIITNTSGGTSSVLDVLNDPVDGLSAIKSETATIVSMLSTIDGKIDKVLARQSSTRSAMIGF